jgi:hypothetical protein
VTNWLTRPLFTVSHKWAGNLWLGLFVVVFLFLISPTIFTLGWHAVHGSTVEFRGHKIVVPLWWIAKPEAQLDLSMTRYPLTLIHGARFAPMASFSPMLPDPKADPETDHNLWEKAFWNTALPSQSVKGPIRIGSVRAAMKRFVWKRSTQRGSGWKRHGASC